MFINRRRCRNEDAFTLEILRVTLRTFRERRRLHKVCGSHCMQRLAEDGERKVADVLCGPLALMVRMRLEIKIHD